MTRNAKHYATAASALKRFRNGEPWLRDKSDAEADLAAMGLIEQCGYCWFVITKKGLRLLAASDGGSSS